MKASEMTEEQKADFMAKIIDGGYFEYMDYCKKRKDGKGYNLRSDNYKNGDMEIVSAHFLAIGFDSIAIDIYDKDYLENKEYFSKLGVEL